MTSVESSDGGESSQFLIKKGGCVNLVLRRGREGVQNPGNFVDVIYVRPPNELKSDLLV